LPDGHRIPDVQDVHPDVPQFLPPPAWWQDGRQRQAAQDGQPEPDVPRFHPRALCQDDRRQQLKDVPRPEPHPWALQAARVLRRQAAPFQEPLFAHPEQVLLQTPAAMQASQA